MNMLVSTTIAGTSVASATQAPDPIFRVIECDRAARTAFSAAVARQSEIEAATPKALRKSSRALAEAEAASDSASDAEQEAALGLVSVFPTTVQGTLALMRYVIEVEGRDGDCWPALVDDNDKARSWHYFLLGQLAEALPAMVPTAQ